MKLEYKILWIDNDDYIYDDHQNTIEDYLNNLGFVPVITKGKNYADFEQLHSSLKEFDLFILDYKLDDRKNGNTIIQEIRDVNNIYTDVVFYSTVKDD